MPFAVFLLSLTVMMGWGTALLASAQGSAATPVQDYYPVGGLSQPNSVTASPNAYVGPIPPTPVLGTFPPTPAPAGGVGSPAVMESGARLRSRVDITCTFFHEDKVPEYQEILTSLAFQWLVGQSSNHSALLYKGLKQILADYQYVLGSTTTAFTPDAVYSTSLDVMLRRLVPLRTLSLVGRGGGPGGGSPSSTSVSQRAQPIAMDYGVYSVASFVLLPLTNTTLTSLGLTPVSTTGGSDGDSPLNFQYPFAAQKTSSLSQNATLVRRLIAATQVATAPTLETDYLCEAFAASFAELILSQPRERLTTLSSPSAWLLSGIVDVRCPRLLTRLPVTGTVGVNVLWIVFIVMGICCLSGAAYALFWRTRSDQDVDINADEKEKVATAIRNGLSAKELPPATKGFMSSSDDEGQQQERAQRQRANSTMQQRQRSPRSGDDEADDGNDLASRIDSKTESIHEIRSSRNQLLDKRKSLRIRDLVAKALTGDSTIYGASEEEREMVAMILKNPRFDGGRLQFDSEASPVEVVLNNDRLFLLPPTDIRLSTKVQGKYHKGQGRVTSVTFPVSVEQDGSIGGAAGGGGTSSSGRNMFLEDVVSAGSLSAQMAAAQADAQQHQPTSDSDRSPLIAKTGRSFLATAAAASPHSEDERGDDEDDSMRINRMMTAAALRNVQRREGHLALDAPSKIKERLQRILEAEADDEWL